MIYRVNTTTSGTWQMLAQKTSIADLISLVVIARHSMTSYKLINKSPVIYQLIQKIIENPFDKIKLLPMI